MSEPRKNNPVGLVPEHVVRERIAFADGVLGAAGHEVVDPRVRDLFEKRVRGEITGEEYRKLVLDG